VQELKITRWPLAWGGFCLDTRAVRASAADVQAASSPRWTLRRMVCRDDGGFLQR
jgi:hypothetical protein